MPEFEINTRAFWTRAGTLLAALTDPSQNEDYAPFEGVDALLIPSGDPSDDEGSTKKSSAIQVWLMGYEFPSTIMLIQKDAITFVCSSSKAKILNQLQGNNTKVPIRILIQAKPKDAPSNALPELLEFLSSSKVVASPLKEKHTGRIVDEWTKLLAPKKDSFEWKDAAPIISTAMSRKDEDEIKATRTASHIVSALLAHHVMPKLELILDRQSTVAHTAIADAAEAKLGTGEKGPDMKVFSKSKHLKDDVDYSSVEIAYTPVIQSRGSKGGYDLKPSAMSEETNIAHSGIIYTALGVKYKGYSAQVGRSFLVDPTDEQDKTYTLLLDLQQHLLTKMRDGVTASEVYTAALEYIKGKNAALESHFVKNIGFAMGLEFRDSTFILNAKNTRKLREGMVFTLSVGFTDLPDKGGKTCALGLLDTIKIGANNAVCLTEGCKHPDEFLFFFDEPEPKQKSSKSKDEKSKSKTNGSSSKSSPSKSRSHHADISGVQVGSKVLRAKTRQQLADPETSKSIAAKIALHQKELHDARHEEGMSRFAGGEGGANEGSGKTWKRFTSYKGEAGLPKEVESLKIYVDRRQQSVVLPINGFPVPFHVNTLKNVSKNDEGDYTYLRINFQTPGQLAGKKEDTPFEDPDATFIRSLSYRSSDNHRFDAIHKQITELKKEANKREQEKKEMADVVEQDNLAEIKGRRPVKMPDVFVRPALDGKRLPGDLEIHSNGLRYLSPLGQKIDILFSNIKHLFFQPCDGEMLVIIHFHLKSPIMIGKKKAKDVQIYREASDVQFDETGNRKRKYRYGDEDEIELEQAELKRRKALNKEFKHFAEKIAEASGDRIEVDIPFRELAFEGVPYRTNVKLQPTTECIVHLSDPPFTVVTIVDIEIASLERVQFSLKQFDLVLIFRDFTKPPLHINSIPTTSLDSVKEWLDSVDIPIAEGPVNLNWSQIMKTINDSPYDFFKDGGWSFLTGSGSDDENGSIKDDSDESEFEADAGDFASSESASDDSGYSDGSNASDEEGSDFGDDDEDSEGEDWDALEKKAAKSDKKKADGGRGHGSESDDDRPKKKSTKSKR